jgi:hypothetical protein
MLGSVFFSPEELSHLRSVVRWYGGGAEEIERGCPGGCTGPDDAEPDQRLRADFRKARGCDGPSEVAYYEFDPKLKRCPFAVYDDGDYLWVKWYHLKVNIGPGLQPEDPYWMYQAVAEIQHEQRLMQKRAKEKASQRADMEAAKARGGARRGGMIPR